MRTLSSASAVTVAAAAFLLLAPAAYADGDNGTVTIHDAATDALLTKKEPEVCTFWLDGSDFDVRQNIDWKVVEMPPTGTRGRVAEVGALSVAEDGHLRSEETLSLEDGRYELVWNVHGEEGPAGRRVFWIDCDGAPEERGEERTQPSASASVETSPVPDRRSADPGPGPTTDAPGGAGAPDSASSPPRVSANGGPGLAETGSDVPAGALATAAASLLGAGTYLALQGRDPRPPRE